MSKMKKEPLLVNFPEDLKLFIKKHAGESGITMSALIVEEMKRLQKRVERVK